MPDDENIEVRIAEATVAKTTEHDPSSRHSRLCRLHDRPCMLADALLKVMWRRCFGESVPQGGRRENPVLLHMSIVMDDAGKHDGGCLFDAVAYGQVCPSAQAFIGDESREFLFQEIAYGPAGRRNDLRKDACLSTLSSDLIREQPRTSAELQRPRKDVAWPAFIAIRGNARLFEKAVMSAASETEKDVGDGRIIAAIERYAP